ncbi:MAG TPA: neutral zinc metallopeptidase [Gemmatimonadales bacterium]
MRWTPGSSTRDVEDRRGASGGGGFRLPGGRMGLGGLVVVLVLSLIFKQDFLSLLAGGDGGAVPGSEAAAPVNASPEEEKLKDFITFVLNDVQSTWDQELPRQTGTDYPHATLVFFREATRTACGIGESATGPFYCPGDNKVYIDLGFYQALADRFGAPGDFAQAYVLAHEIGHHLQALLGTEAQVRDAQERRPDQANNLSVRMELQADCYAGVWGFYASRRGQLQAGDVEEGLAAAAAVGDDRIQEQMTGRVHPESFTHGTADQRAAWFNRGLSSGTISSCDTFAAR